MIDTKLFYKYQSLAEYYDKDYNYKNYILRNLAQNQLYFNDPNNFNDPFDCRIRVDFAGTKEQWIDLLCDKYERSPKQAEEKVNGFKKEDNGLVCPHNASSYLKVPIVCCFSSKCDNILMWSHYADSHLGICLGFEASGENDYYSMPLYESDTDESPSSGEFKQVIYDSSNDLCIVKMFDDQYKNANIVEDRIFTKLHAWEYECEYRMRLLESHIREPRVLKYDKSCLKKVIFGLKIDKRNVIRVYNVINENYLKEGFEVEFFEAKEIIGKYELNIEKIPNMADYIASFQ